MKLGLYADPHFSRSSSIITGKIGQFSGRLDNLIKSFDWMNNLFRDHNVDAVVCLGDLVDKPILNSEEITAMSRCGLEDHYIVLGNHCRSDKDGNINAVSNYSRVVNKIGYLFDGVYVLPYNSDVVDLKSINPRPKIILSHNDIKGYSLNGHIMTSGYELSDILGSCDLFVNGHLHDGGWLVKDRVLNLGVISGVNFSSCNGEWNPSVAIVDTDTITIELFENPVAYKFRKVEFDTLPKLKGYLSGLTGTNYVIQLKVPDKISQSARKLINQYEDKVASSRVIVTRSQDDVQTSPSVNFNSSESIIDKLKKFINGQTTKYDKSVLSGIIDEMCQMTEGEV